MTRGTAVVLLAAVLAAALVVRVGYVQALPESDPTFAAPMLDGAYYLDWARAIVSGTDGPRGAYYLAPLYPHLLAGFLALFGERYGILALLQNALMLGTAILLFATARRSAGDVAALCTATLFLLYHPVLFFASRPLGDTTALFFLAASLFLVMLPRTVGAGASGVSAGVAALARPNLLLVGGALVLSALSARRWARSIALLGGILLVVLPVTLRNLAVSGHAVPISANDGITLYHGNGPGALGVYTPAEGLSGNLARQQEEVTALARMRAARNLDPVEADRWFRAEALRTRLTAPLGTMWLLGRRLMLLFDNFEHALDYAPSLDTNRWRWGAPLPFAVLLGLAGAGVVSVGFRRSGGAPLWGAIVACAFTPIVFYVSSRYRLPMAALLTVPAGAGAASLVGAGDGAPSRRPWLAASTAVVLMLGSLLVPSDRLRRSEEATALANRAIAIKGTGDLATAERDLRAALALDTDAAPVWYNLGVVLEGSGRLEEAERAYGTAMLHDPANADSAANLGALLVRRGDPDGAVEVLRQGLAEHPEHVACWTNLVVALVASGRTLDAREAARRAEENGVLLNPELKATIGGDEATSALKGEEGR